MSKIDNPKKVTEPTGPIVIHLKKKRKNKKRYSKNLAEVQEMERHLVRASHRMAKAVEKGIANYRFNRIKSAKKQKDGAIRDFIPNSGVAMTHALKEVGAVPNDITKALNTKPMRRRIRKQITGIRKSLR